MAEEQLARETQPDNTMNADFLWFNNRDYSKTVGIFRAMSQKSLQISVKNFEREYILLKLNI